MARRLFCQINKYTYSISLMKERIRRYLIWIFGRKNYSNNYSEEQLPFVAYQHNSLIRRTLGDVDIILQNNKAINLKLAAPKVNGILIKPGETFSFWKLVGNCTRRKGYLDGLVIKSQKASRGIGGGMCQFTNLIHWMVLHSPLDITERHHHNQIDLFPDFNRQIPFGTGTSIFYNYLDYQFTNNTKNLFQILIRTTDTHLVGELRCDKKLDMTYHIIEKNNCFTLEDGEYFRNNEIYRRVIDRRSGMLLNEECLIKNHSKVLYDSKYIPINS